MHRLLVRLAVGLALSLATAFAAEPAKEKSPADTAADAFFKLRDAKDAKPAPDRMQQVLKAGMAFIIENPTHSRTGAVITSLATFGTTMNDKSQAALRDYWRAQVSYEVTNRRMGAEDDVRAALAALDAAVLASEVREKPGRENLGRLREKIDTLAGLPGGDRFLSTREQEYLDILKVTNPTAAEAHATKLSTHKDKRVAGMARDALNLMEMGKQPLDLKFTALDGRAVDTTAFRKKAVAVFFWSAANANSVKDLEALKELQSTYRTALEIVLVSYDAESDRAKVEQVVKDKKLKWPVHFDGKGKENETWSKLNVRSVPVLMLIAPDGMLVNANLRVNRLEAEIKKMFKLK